MLDFVYCAIFGELPCDLKYVVEVKSLGSGSNRNNRSPTLRGVGKRKEDSKKSWKKKKTTHSTINM